ncbi:MAG: hypothetical protein R3B13_19830 [Polyangiaceae bacterium]
MTPLAIACVQCTLWLPAESVFVDRSASAHRDLPVFEYSYGPRARAVLGAPLRVLESRGESSSWGLGLAASVALANADAAAVGPRELWRDYEELDVSWQPLIEGLQQRLDVNLGVGHFGAQRSAGVSLEAPRPDDIPFGGGGYFLSLGVTLHQTGDWAWYARASHRAFTNGIIEAVSKEASDAATSVLAEGLAHAPSLEGSLRYRGLGLMQPVVSGSADWLVPADDSARSGWVLRALTGLAFAGQRGELLPFVAGDVGNGEGMLINRREARLLVGVRYALR